MEVEMTKVHENLYIGTVSDCSVAYDMAILHACKTCHQRILNYPHSPSKDDKNYLIYKPDSDNLYLNLLDLDSLEKEYTDVIVTESLLFIDKHIKTKPVLVHCDFGVSRSASLGMLYMAASGSIANDCYMSAARAFKNLYPPFSAGYGVSNYMEENWNMLLGII